MDAATLTELGTRYDLAQLRARLPRGIAAPVHAFDAAVVRADGWRTSVVEALRTATDRPWQRVVFDAVETPAMRVLVDVVECSSPDEALDELLERLAGNQLAKLEEGPQGLGFAAFQHPPFAPPAVFFARDNLCISVVSFGSRPVQVLTWAERLVQALAKTPR